jgi:sulfur carrier protein
MAISVIIGEEEKKLDIEGNKTIKDLLQMLEIPVETVVVKKNQSIVMEEEPLADGDSIEIIRVIYGG